MVCPTCGAKAHVNQTFSDRIAYKCTNEKCTKKHYTVHTEEAKTNNIGMSLDQFRSKFDVDFILAETLKKLDPETIYEKNDVYQMTGLSPSYPGLGHALEAADDYYGKAGGKPLFSHPDTIRMLKETAKLK